MSKKRIIPLLLIKNNNILYKGCNFDCWRSVGNVINAVKVFNHREVDEMILFDVNATQNCSLIDSNIVKHIAENFNMPLTVGGGIKCIDDASQLFNSGADRICINSSAYTNHELIKDISNKFGKQSLVVSIDYKKIGNDYYCFKNNCTINTNIKVTDWIEKLINLGCLEILLTSYDFEGKLTGMDKEFIENKLISANYNISIIFGGGVGTPEDAYNILKYNCISGLSIGSLFYFTRYTPNDIKKKCLENNLKLRLPYEKKL
jgi:imidazole glycerol-phosphate synthase subunit HisF